MVKEGEFVDFAASLEIEGHQYTTELQVIIDGILEGLPSDE